MEMEKDDDASKLSDKAVKTNVPVWQDPAWIVEIDDTTIGEEE